MALYTAVYVITLYLLCQCTQFAFLQDCKADEKEHWTYRGQNGPQFWSEIGYPQCEGNEQSPVAIDSRSAIRDPRLRRLRMINYFLPVRNGKIENDGHTVKITPEDGIPRSIFINNVEYRLVQVHFHWGMESQSGTEHSIDDATYSMEGHFVHQDIDNRLAVVGVIYQIQAQQNTGFRAIIEALPKILYKGDSVTLSRNLNLNWLLPANPASFYRYNGSLTTPECSEGVIWNVLRTRQRIGSAQMDEFRKLYSTKEEDAAPGCTLSNNYRPLQPLNDRKIFRSY